MAFRNNVVAYQLLCVDCSVRRIDIFELVEKMNLGWIRKIVEFPLRDGFHKNVVVYCKISPPFEGNPFISRLRAGETLQCIDSSNVWKWWSIRCMRDDGPSKTVVY